MNINFVETLLKNSSEKTGSVNGVSNGVLLKRLFNVKEAANYLAISETGIYRFVEWGLLAYRRLLSVPNHKSVSQKERGQIVFELSDLDGFVDRMPERRQGNRR